jgi:hypothetical protein
VGALCSQWIACSPRRNGARGRPLNWVVSHQKMRTRELRNNAGQLTGFEISNAVITRNGVQRVVKRIPGVSITKETHSWRITADDDFLHFVLNERRFIAEEPFGDSDCYCIMAGAAPDAPEIQIVIREFEKHRVWGIL